MSIRVNGQTYGARAHNDNVYHTAEKLLPTAVVRGTANEVTTYVQFDETALGSLAGVQPFADIFEQQAAFRDPRYSRSPAFRAEVMRRMEVGRQIKLLRQG